MSFKQINKINRRTKYSVYGWIRNKEKELKLGNVPKMISVLCILYFREDEIFNIISTNGVKLSENKKKIEKVGEYSGHNSNYGVIEIPSTSNLIYRWDIQTFGISNNYTIQFGISSKQMPNCYTSKVSAELNGGCIYYKFGSQELEKFGRGGKASNSSYLWHEYGSHFKEGDIVSLHLDLKRAEIKLIINEKDQGIAFTNVKKSNDIKYHFFATIEQVGRGLEILNFVKE